MMTLTGTMSGTMTVAVSNSGTGSNAATPAPSMTGTSSNAPKTLLAVTNIQTVCPSEKQVSCLTWNYPVGIRYTKFQVDWKPSKGGSSSTLTTSNLGATIIGLTAGSTYTVTVTGIANNGQKGPSSTISVTTAPDRFQGLKNVNCKKAGTSVVCRWNNGTTRYNNIKLVVKCAGSKRQKVIIPSGRNQYKITNAGNNCNVELVPRYVNGKTEKFTFNI
jgi:hypothetical protein